MKEKLMEDLKTAMKNKDIVKKNTIQMIRAAILQTEKDKQTELDNNTILEIISKQIKQKNEKTTILAIGAITNVALAIMKAPEIINKIKVVWLGVYYLSKETELNRYLLDIFKNCKKSFIKEPKDEIGSSKTLWDLISL